MEEKIIETLLGKNVDLTKVDRGELKNKVKILLSSLMIASGVKK